MESTFFLTVSIISPLERLLLGALMVVIGFALLKYFPEYHEKHFPRYKATPNRVVAGPAFIIVLGVLFIIGGSVRLF
jgi:hypothetical protein